jgi:hypothetical protein
MLKTLNLHDYVFTVRECFRTKFPEAYEESQYNIQRSRLSRRICKS